MYWARQAAMSATAWIVWMIRRTFTRESTIDVSSIFCPWSL
jgi:hypothetical protein